MIAIQIKACISPIVKDFLVVLIRKTAINYLWKTTTSLTKGMTLTSLSALLWFEFHCAHSSVSAVFKSSYLIFKLFLSVLQKHMYLCIWYMLYKSAQLWLEGTKCNCCIHHLWKEFSKVGLQEMNNSFTERQQGSNWHCGGIHHGNRINEDHKTNSLG